ncbi:MAG TPA: hypothetical protein VNQ77_12925 [Frankiaceae bacterium]|nr:hypothetical protein [Frankiaceae bacterium]
MRPGVAVARLCRANPVHAAVWAGVVASFVVAGSLTGNDRVWPYLTVVLVCTAITALVDRNVGFSSVAIWLLVLTGTLHLSGGIVPDPTGSGVLYGMWLLPEVLRFDQVVHAVGSVAATVTAWQLLGTWLGAATPARTQAWLAALAGLGKGAVNEVVEFLVAMRVPGTFVGGFENTGWDLVFDTVGVVGAATFLVLSRAPRRPVRDARALVAVPSVAEVAA